MWLWVGVYDSRWCTYFIISFFIKDMSRDTMGNTTPKTATPATQIPVSPTAEQTYEHLGHRVWTMVYYTTCIFAISTEILKDQTFTMTLALPPLLSTEKNIPKPCHSHNHTMTLELKETIPFS